MSTFLCTAIASAVRTVLRRGRPRTPHQQEGQKHPRAPKHVGIEGLEERLLCRRPIFAYAADTVVNTAVPPPTIAADQTFEATDTTVTAGNRYVSVERLTYGLSRRGLLHPNSPAVIATNPDGNPLTPDGRVLGYGTTAKKGRQLRFDFSGSPIALAAGESENFTVYVTLRSGAPAGTFSTTVIGVGGHLSQGKVLKGRNTSVDKTVRNLWFYDSSLNSQPGNVGPIGQPSPGVIPTPDGPELPVPPGTSLPGDLNGDGVVNSQDDLLANPPTTGGTNPPPTSGGTTTPPPTEGLPNVGNGNGVIPNDFDGDGTVEPWELALAA